jgi:tRNA nucleotidyltransferase (CCA-adding enzyme)
MEITVGAQAILHRLNTAGYEAYVVGGCVRDTLLGRTPGDWDICTSALPEETEACFPDCKVLETGLRHGTVTVLWEGTPYEITTFRQDGAYLGHRRPEQVQYVKSLREDLARRDFTIGAMAAGADGAILDPFDGQTDLEAHCIRCVGDPDLRFEEDALRILRGLRFASQLGFSITPETAQAMERQKELLTFISGERLYTELTKLLVGPAAAEVLEQYGSVLTPVLPEIVPAMGFLQKNPYHDRDVWGHTLDALSRSRPDPIVRWALLLHDLGKPDCFTVDDSGQGHFYGHPARGEELARDIFARLKADSHTRDMVSKIVRFHDYDAPASRKTARRWLVKFGVELLPPLLEVKRCDCLAHVDTPKVRMRYDNLMALTDLIHQALAEAPCLSVRDLKVTGRDILDMGIPKGPQVGVLLNQLLEDVVEERCENTREALLRQLQATLCEKGIS